MPLIVAALLLALIVVEGLATAGSVQNTPRFPPRIDGYFRDSVKLTLAQQRHLAGGHPVTKLLDADETKEAAVFGAIWIAAPIRRYLDALKDIESFERGGGFKVTKRINTPPRLADFAQLQLPQEDLADLRACRVGSCDVKLGEEALNRFRTQINWHAPDAYASANRLMQQIAFEYVTRYLAGGNDSLAVQRDSRHPTRVAEEFRSMVDKMPELTTYMPEIRRYLLEYPKGNLPGATDHFYWQETEFGLKPTIRISHMTIREQPDAVVASKMLYATHYFLTGVELRMLVPDASRGPGFWFVSVNRSRLDGLTGLTGVFVRWRLKSRVQQATLTVLRDTKTKLEAIR